MIRKLLGRVGVVATVLGMTVVAPIAAAGAAHADAASGISVCGFLDDGGGAGSASSLLPGATPQGGDTFSQRTTGAWRLCYDFNSERLTLYAYQGTWCMADNNGIAVLRSCNGHADQQWVGVVINGPFIVQNANGGVLCAEGGVSYVDVVNAPSNCSTYHQTWQFEGSA